MPPTLGAACSLIGGPQVRWRGTLGGNLANASPAGDTIPALYVLGATVEILAADGQQREVPVAELFVGPRRSILADGDLVVAVRLPLRENLRGAYLRLDSDSRRPSARYPWPWRPCWTDCGSCTSPSRVAPWLPRS